MYWCYVEYIILSASYFLYSNALSETNCTPFYHVEEITYNKAVSSDFYFTSTNVKSPDECANFCSGRQFCRTAVYNSFARTCSISYDWVLNCRSHSRRYSNYRPSSERQLIRITCIDGCNGINNSEIPPTDGNKLKVTTTPVIRWTDGDSAKYYQPFTSTVATRTISTSTTATTTVATIIVPSTSATNTTSIITSTTATITVNAETPSTDAKLPNRTIFEAYENTTSRSSEHHVGDSNIKTVVHDSNNKTAETISRASGTPNNQATIRILEDIVRHARANPNNYKLYVERNDGEQSKVIVRIEDQKSKNAYDSLMRKVPNSKQSVNFSGNEGVEYHMLRIKLPYTFVDNETTTEPINQQAKVLQIDTPNSCNYSKTTFQEQKNFYNDEQLLEGRDGTHREREHNYKRLPPRYVDNQHGYLYRVRIHDSNHRGSTVNRTDISERDFRRNEVANERAVKVQRDDSLSAKSVLMTNLYCYGMVNRKLLHNAAYTSLNDISLEECGCACMETWTDNENCLVKCKSFQYSNITRKCTLNINDHNGKYDLVYDSKTDYYYTLCTAEDVIKTIAQSCRTGKVIATTGTSTPQSTSQNWNSVLNLWNKNTHSTRKRSTNDDPASPPPIGDKKSSFWSKIDIFETENKAQNTNLELTLMPTWSKTLKSESAARKLKYILHKRYEESQEKAIKGNGYYEGAIQSTQSSIRQSRSTKEIDGSIQNPTTLETISTNSSKMLDKKLSLPFKKLMNKAPYGEVEDITEKKKSTGINKGEIDHVKLKKMLAKISDLSNERIKMNVEEAEGKQKLTKAKINLESEEDENFDQELDYYDNKNGVNNNNWASTIVGLMPDVEGSGENMQPSALINDLEIPEADSDEVDSDRCFLEMPNYVLQGTVFAAEANVSVEACKCYCIDANVRYGTECFSVQYYYDSMTCLLNNKNRSTDPRSFNFAPAATMKHSYFDLRCRTENDAHSLYLEEFCASVIDLSPKQEKFSTPQYSAMDGISLMDEIKNKSNDSTTDVDVSTLIVTTHSIPSTQNSTTNMPRLDGNLLQEELGEEDYEGDEGLNQLGESKDVQNTTISVLTSFFGNSVESSFTSTSTVLEDTDNVHFGSTTTLTMTLGDEIVNDESVVTIIPVTAVTYPETGPCVYSAIYQSALRGAKLIKRILVSSPKQCFYGCHFEKCRSANLVQIDSETNYCDLFSDALIDYRTPDILVYDSGSVYFDGIKCK